MHIHFEKTINAQCDCTILSMSWMGKVPDELPEDEGWKLNRTHYYQEGWLATGNVRGVLGVTYTTSHWKRNSSDVPLRTNYNLRGHRSQITLVQWNEPYQKLASCDSSGIIFVWIKFEGRWSIELINDRNTPVTHFSWSHDGRMALICYQDNFVLVGSVAGQRYWSTLLSLDATITCGIWTPDDQQVYFGTSNGQVVVMDVHGVMLSQVQLPSDSPISSMAWSCEKFKMEESEDGEATSSSNHYCSKRPFLLAVCFKTGGIYLMKSYDDMAPTYISTGMHGLHMEWSNSGEFLAVAGSRPIEVLHENGNRVKEYSNSLHVYNHQGTRIVNINIPHVLSPVTSMTWGHNDKRIFIATGKLVHVGWISKRIASLQLLCRLAIYRSLSTETCVSHLPLPLPVRALISSLHTQTIPSLLQNVKDLRDFVTHPPSGNLRLYCTMIRHDDDSNQSPGTAYTLYLEYLGGLIPILKGKRTSKIRPEFVIYDPQATEERSFSLLVQQGSAERSCSVGSAACGIDGGIGAAYCCHCNHHHAVHFHHHLNSCHGSGDNGASICNKSTCPGANNFPTPCTSSACSASNNAASSVQADGSWTNNGLPAHYHCHCCCHHHHHHTYHHHLHHLHPQASGNVGSSTTTVLSQSCNASTIGSSTASLGLSDSSESEDVELCASPRMQRKRYRNRQRERERLLEREREREWERTRSSVHLMPEPAHPHQLIYNDVLPEAVRLVEVTSNIWGTKFKIHGVSPQLPDSLGQITYKTSLLHLQPRQMTLLITELRDDIFFSPDSLLVHGGYLDEDEEDLSVVVGPEPSLSLSSVPPQNLRYPQQNSQQNGASAASNGEGGGGGVRGDVYTGANVIYHPQGVPRGEDSPPIISTSRCYLQSSSPSSSSSLQNYQQQNIASSSNSSAPSNGPSKNYPGPSGSGNGPSTSSYGSTQLPYNASSSSSCTTGKSELYDTDDTDEFPYVDLTANSEIIQFRETLKNSMNYESVSTSNSSRDSHLISNCRSGMCQVCEPSPAAVPHTPMRVITSTGIVGGNGGGSETSVDLSDKALQRIKYGQMRAQVERIVAESHQNSGDSMVGGVATSTPTPPPRSARSLRSPKKVSGSGSSSSSSRLSTFPHYITQNQIGCVTDVVNSVPNQQSTPSLQGYSHELYEQQLQQMQPVPVTAPMFVRRSMSASYLDNVDRNIVSLDVVGNDVNLNSPPKRLILVKKRGQNGGADGNNDQALSNPGGKPRLKDWGKSKSWDSCDLSAWKNGCKSAGPGGSSTYSSTASSYRREISTMSCPKCRFPSTEPMKACVTMAEPLVHGRANIPMTPQRRNVMTNCSTSRNTILALQPKPGPSGSSCTLLNQSRKNSKDQGRVNAVEDAIENADNSSTSSSPSSSTPTHRARGSPSPSPTPPPSTPPPPPQQSSSFSSTVHRRSLSLLTPLLKRREMLNASRQQQSADASSRKQSSSSQASSNGSSAPHSSTFIPPGSPQHQPRSSPSTPVAQRRSRQSYLSTASSPFRQLFVNSPLLSRRKNKGNNGNGSNRVASPRPNGSCRRRSMIDSSDDEGTYDESSLSAPPPGTHNNPIPSSSGSSSNCSTVCSSVGLNNDASTSSCAHASSGGSSSSTQVPSSVSINVPGRDCEVFQRSQMEHKVHHQKVGRKKIQCMEPCPMAPRRREFLMHNKAPMWNENSQVYQLDFGGRVTQESAKNFQIEFRGKQVMQFGRIDGSAYTLDFQYPFAAVQAFSVALANVTQRLK